MRTRSCVLILFMVIVYNSSGAQIKQSDSTGILTYKKNIFLSFFFPKGIAEGVVLRSYLRSEPWGLYKRTHSDREAFDEIFRDAYELCYGNRSGAIFAASIAVLEHRNIPVKFLFGIILPIPLTMESEQDFNLRVRELPAHIYGPKISDVDKLQHFFFSALLERALKMKWLVRLLGDAVEIGEDLFIEGGVDDPRDRHANEDGIGFGSGCEPDSLPMPSTFLTPNP